MKKGFIKVKLRNKASYGSTVNYSIGPIEVDENGYAEVPEEFVEENLSSFFIDEEEEDAPEVKELKPKEDPKPKVPSPEEAAELLRKKKEEELKSEEKKEEVKEEEPKAEEPKEEAKEEKKEEPKGEPKEEAPAEEVKDEEVKDEEVKDAEDLEPMKVELRKKTVPILQELAKELECPAEEWEGKLKEDLIEYLAPKI